MLRILNTGDKWILVGTLAIALSAPFDSAHAKRFNVLYSFAGGSDGAYPGAGLIADATGNLYGTTEEGGGSTNCTSGCGVVFRIAPDGTESVLYTFTGGSDGAFPRLGSLIMDAAGNLYGTTLEGGSTGCGGYGCGTVFKLAPDGTEAIIHAFTGGSDGSGPEAGLIADAAGNLYGTTAAGGGSSNCTGGCGTVFELAPDGTEIVLHAFAGGTDGAIPYAGLIEGASGNLYGTTLEGGGAHSCGAGCGTVFKLAPDRSEKVLYAFTLGSDGAFPAAAMIKDKAGNLYSTTEGGGANGQGTVFKVAPSGIESVLYAFTGGTDGADPEAGLIADNAGNLYGTTVQGGDKNLGTVFELAPNGTETVLHSFSGGSDGSFPLGNLLKQSHTLYGTTEGLRPKQGRYGTVFELKD